MPGIPAGAPVAAPIAYAGTWRRFAALAIDVVILAFAELMLLTPLALVVQALGVSDDYDGPIAEAVLFFVYFAVAWSVGQSFGMRILGIRLERLEGEGPPGPQRGLIRAGLGVPPLLALFFLLAFKLPEESQYASTVDAVLLPAALLVLFAGLVARLTMIRHPHHQSLVDEAAGVVVVRVARENAETVAQPWQPTPDGGVASPVGPFDREVGARQLVLPGIPPPPVARAWREVKLAPKGTRFAAFALDCLLLFVSSPLWGVVLIYPLVEVFGDAAGWLGLLGGFVTYFTVGWGRGQTPGMRLAGIRHERADRGGRPGYRRGFVRALLGGTPPFGLLVILLMMFFEPPEGFGTFYDSLALTAMALVIVGPLMRLTMIRHPRRQSLVDRAAGVVVVRATPEATAPAPQAWQAAFADAAGQVEAGQWPTAARPVAGMSSVPAEPAGREQFAFTGARLAALFFDLVLLNVTAGIWGSVLIFPLLAVFPEAVAVLIGATLGPTAYFAFAWGRGRTLGMRLLSIHLERADGGGRPGYRRGIGRSLLATFPLAASVVTLGLWFDRFLSCAGDPACRPADDFPLLMAGLVLFGIALGTRLTMRFHPRHQSVIDRAAGVVVLLDAPKPRRGG